jgi:hypothetical protein
MALPAGWEPWVAAAFAPVAVWVLWRLQVVSVELLRGRLVVLSTRWDQKWIYAIVSWFGVFLHELSHASVLVLSGHGLKQFRAGVEEGHILPARMQSGPVGFLFFLVAALAPLFIPPLLVLLGFWLIGVDLPGLAEGGVGLQAALDLLRGNFVAFPKALALAIAGLDLAQWRHAAVFALVLLGIPAARPSHVKTKWHARGEGDVAVLRARIRSNPVPFVAFLLLVYAAYFLATWRPEAYWYPVQGVWRVALTGITLALFGAAWWFLAGLDGRAMGFVSWMGPAAFVAVQVLGRALDWPVTILQLNGLSLAAWLVVSLAVGAILPRR